MSLTSVTSTPANISSYNPNSGAEHELRLTFSLFGGSRISYNSRWSLQNSSNRSVNSSTCFPNDALPSNLPIFRTSTFGDVHLNSSGVLINPSSDNVLPVICLNTFSGIFLIGIDVLRDLMEIAVINNARYPCILLSLIVGNVCGVTYINAYLHFLAMDSSFSGVNKIGSSFATLNAVSGVKVYSEKLVRSSGKEYRLWDPFRSKLCAAMKKELKTFPFVRGAKVLYLGASTGTTISHLSDIVGDDGEIYAVEIASQCMKSLHRLCEKRENIIPIHGDARQPHEYEEVGKVDVLYQDVAQPDQDDILMKNADMFLKKDGIAMICIKSQSIDVTKKPQDVFDVVLAKVETKFEILEKIKLEPYDKDHLFVVLKYGG